VDSFCAGGNGRGLIEPGFTSGHAKLSAVLEHSTNCSPLPERLRQLGYDPAYRSEETRIGAPARPEYTARWRQEVKSAGHGFFQVNVFEVRLPK
jgi:hypothetical protein